PDEESLESCRRFWWIIRRTWFGDRRRAGRIRHRHRNLRFDPRSFATLWRDRTASHFWPRQSIRRYGALLDAGSAWPDVPLCRRLRDRDECHCEAGWAGYERLRHSIQLERAARYKEAA